MTNQKSRTKFLWIFFEKVMVRVMGFRVFRVRVMRYSIFPYCLRWSDFTIVRPGPNPGSGPSDRAQEPGPCIRAQPPGPGPDSGPRARGPGPGPWVRARAWVGAPGPRDRALGPGPGNVGPGSWARAQGLGPVWSHKVRDLQYDSQGRIVDLLVLFK